MTHRAATPDEEARNAERWREADTARLPYTAPTLRPLTNGDLSTEQRDWFATQLIDLMDRLGVRAEVIRMLGVASAAEQSLPLGDPEEPCPDTPRNDGLVTAPKA